MPVTVLIILKLRTGWHCQYFIHYGNTLFNEQIYEKVILSSLSKPSHMSYLYSDLTEPVLHIGCKMSSPLGTSYV